ncbi:3D domain-containing protein [Pseudomonas sp.]|uniref:3D domain-containing protein n=1 Tax=Pseudomonas sp. TaxID=306 RepID=UPI0035269D91
MEIKHDDYFFSGDTGGAIKGSHIDVFCETKSKNCLPGIIRGDGGKNEFEARVVSDPNVVEFLLNKHRPSAQH